MQVSLIPSSESYHYGVLPLSQLEYGSLCQRNSQSTAITLLIESVQKDFQVVLPVVKQFAFVTLFTVTFSFYTKVFPSLRNKSTQRSSGRGEGGIIYILSYSYSIFKDLCLLRQIHMPQKNSFNDGEIISQSGHRNIYHAILFG